MTFQLLGEAAFAGTSVSFDRFEGGPASLIKLVVTGQLQALGIDRPLMLQVNGMTDGYKTYAFSQGDYPGTETHGGGFYLGRSGYGADATFLLEVNIAKVPSAQQITCNGLSTFAHHAGGNKLLCFECHSALPTVQPIQSLSLFFKGGIVSNDSVVRLFRM